MIDQKELEHQKAWGERLLYYLKGNVDAARFCIDLIYIAHLWDDLIDKDKDRTDSEINDAFRIALVDIPRNPFYTAHIRELQPLIYNAILQWYHSTALEDGSVKEKQIAFMLRNALLQIITYSICMVGGESWHATAGLEFQKECWEDFDLLFTSFLKEKNHA